MSLVRDSMIHLIERERTLIGDADGSVFRDDEIQDALDMHRSEVRFAALKPEPSFEAGGVVYRDYFSSLENWDDGAKIQTLDYADVTSQATTYEPIVGHWAFDAQPAGLALRVSGRVYDLNAAAGDLLLQWAGRVQLEFTVSADGEKLDREGQFRMLMQRSQYFRSQAQPRSVRVTQSDAAPDMEGGGVVYPNLGSWGEW